MLRFIAVMAVCLFFFSVDTAILAAPRQMGQSSKIESTVFADGTREVRKYDGEELRELKVYGHDGSYRKGQWFWRNGPYGRLYLWREELWDEQAQIRIENWYSKEEKLTEKRTYQSGVVQVLKSWDNGSRTQLTWVITGSVRPGEYVGSGRLTEVRTWDADDRPLCVYTLAEDNETVAKIEYLQNDRPTKRDWQTGKSIDYYFADESLRDREFGPPSLLFVLFLLATGVLFVVYVVMRLGSF